MQEFVSADKSVHTQLHLVELARRRVGDDAPDLLAVGLDGVLGPLAVEHDRVLLRDGDGPSRAEQVGGHPLELDVQLVREHGFSNSTFWLFTSMTKYGLMNLP